MSTVQWVEADFVVPYYRKQSIFQISLNATILAKITPGDAQKYVALYE
jgi:hypothetical protein